MDPNDTNTEHRESAVINGGDLTEEEARLVAEGVEERDEDTAGPAAKVDESAGADDGGKDADAAAAEAAEAARLQQEADAAAEQERVAAAARVAAPQVQAPAKPEPPKDFGAEVKALEDAYADGDIDAVELNRKTRELTLEEADHRAVVRSWEQQQAFAAEQAKVAAENDWNQTAVAFEEANKEFLSNPLRHRLMQDAINTVLASGEALSNQQVLTKALAIATDYTGWQAPAPAPAVDPKDQREKVGEALGNRKAGAAPTTLGDAPAARNEEIKGSESFVALDGLPITELEATFANMSPAQQEKYLADAEGATANGRD